MVAVEDSSFDKLFFSSYTPHILEAIFFSLDYESYKMCLEVNKTWKDLLTSERYITKGRSVFYKDIQVDEKKLFIYCNFNARGRLLTKALLAHCDTIEGIFNLFSYRLLKIRRLLSSGMVNVNCRDKKQNNQTPLHAAALTGDKEVAKLLIAHGADVNAACGSGRMPLHYATSRGHKKLAQLLIQNGADTKKSDTYVARALGNL